MAGLEYGFDQFKIGDNPYNLGNGAVRSLAALGGVELSEEPNFEEIQAALFDNWGTEKTFRSNVDTFTRNLPDGLDARDTVADVVEESGIMSAISPRSIAGDKAREFDVALIGGGTYNWIERRTQLLHDLLDQGHKVGEVVMLGTFREMKSETELSTDFVRDFQNRHGEMPTEVHHLAKKGEDFHGRGLSVGLSTGDKMGFKALVEQAAPQLEGKRVLVVQNAPAGSTFADVRGVVTDENLFFATDSVRIARTDEEEADARHYQKYASAPSALARWVKAVHEINQQQ